MVCSDTDVDKAVSFAPPHGRDWSACVCWINNFI